MGLVAPPPLNLPTSDQVDAFYKQWFKQNYLTPCGKTPPSVIQFVLAAFAEFTPSIDPDNEGATTYTEA